MMKNKIFKLLTGRAELRQQLVFKNIISVIIIFAAVVLQLLRINNIGYFNALSEKPSAALDSFISVLIVICIIRIIKNIKLLKNEEALKTYEINLKDERNISIQRRALSSTVIVCVYIGCISGLLYLPYNMAIAYTLFYSICVLLIVYLIFSFIYNKIM